MINVVTATPKKARTTQKAAKAKGQAKKAAPATSKAAKPAKPSKVPAAKPKAEKKVAAKDDGDGGPRAGTVGRYIYDRVLAGDDNAEISKTAIKRFDNEKINASYVSWWRNSFAKKGMLPVPLNLKKK